MSDHWKKRSSFEWCANTTHDIIYFFATDRIADGKFRVQYCPTGNMVVTFLTKPLQGSLYRKFQAMVLSLPEDTISLLETDSHDCVGKPNVGKPNVQKA